MALSRFSFSNWYIYEVGSDDERILHIEGVGNCNLIDLSSNFDDTFLNLINKAYHDPKTASKYDILELKLYLKHWMEFLTNKINREEYHKKIEFMRKKGATKKYLEQGYLSREIIESYGMNPKEKLIYIENNRCFTKTCDDFETRIVTIKKFNLTKIIKSVTIEYKNSKQQIVSDRVNFPNFSEENYPLIIGKSYVFNKESNTFYNIRDMFLETNRQDYLDFIELKLEKLKKLKEKLSNLPNTASDADFSSDEIDEFSFN